MKDKHQEKADENILPTGTKVMCITPPGKTWHPTTVKEYLGYHLYKIKADNGATYVRTRLHLKPYKPYTQPTPTNTKTSHTGTTSASYNAMSINQGKKGTDTYGLVK